MGFTLNLSQVAQGAMKRYLDTDDARIAQAAKDRERKDDQDFDLKKLEIAHKYRLKEDEAKAKQDLIEASAIERVDPDFAYAAISRPFHKKATEMGMSVLDTNEKLSKRFGTGKTELRRLAWLESNIGILFKDDNKLLKQNKEFAQHLLEQANYYIDSGEFSGKRTNSQGQPIDGQYFSDAFNNIQKLADLSGEFGFGTQGKAYYSLFDSATKNQFTPTNKVSAGIVQKLHNSTSLKAKGEYKPRNLTNSSLNLIEATADLNLIDHEILAIGHFGIGQQGYETGKNALISKLRDTGSGLVSDPISKGENTRGDRTSSQQLDLIGSFVFISSQYKRPQVVKQGRISFLPKIPKENIDEARKMGRVLPDAKNLVKTTDRLVQLNDEMSLLINATPNFQPLVSDKWRSLYTKVAAFAEVLGFDDKKAQSVLSKGLSGTYENQLRKDIGANSEDQWGNNLRDSMSSAFKRLDERIEYLKRNKGQKVSVIGTVTDEIIKREIEYAYLKIQTIFHVAKLIQGGTGGRGVSNMDFEMVAKSLSQGTLSTLKTERIAFAKLNKDAVDSYVSHLVGSKQEIEPKSGFSRVLEDKILNIYWSMKSDTSRRDSANKAGVLDPDTTDSGTVERNGISRGLWQRRYKNLKDKGWKEEEIQEYLNKMFFIKD